MGLNLTLPRDGKNEGGAQGSTHRKKRREQRKTWRGQLSHKDDDARLKTGTPEQAGTRRGGEEARE